MDNDTPVKSDGRMGSLAGVLFLIPFRCRSCGNRFRRYISAPERAI